MAVTEGISKIWQKGLQPQQYTSGPSVQIRIRRASLSHYNDSSSVFEMTTEKLAQVL